MTATHLLGPAPLYTNCFLLVGENKHAVAIDPAAAPEQFEKLLEEAGATLTHILLTHGHYDHVGSVEPLREKYGAKLYMNEADNRQFELNADEFFVDGGEIVVDDMGFTTIFTPGHTPGSTCIVCGDLMFSGDTLFAGDIGRTDLPGGDSAEMRRSLQKLCKLVTTDVQVLPGHEEFSTMDAEKRDNPYLRF